MGPGILPETTVSKHKEVVPASRLYSTCGCCRWHIVYSLFSQPYCTRMATTHQRPQTCRTMESPMITASCSFSRRVEILKTRGGGGGEVLARGLAHVFRCWCTRGPWCPGVGVKEAWEDCVLGLCRGTHGVEVVGVLAACCILTPDLRASAQDVSSVALCSLSWACFSGRSWICFSMASSSRCTECSSNTSSPALKGRQKYAI